MEILLTSAKFDTSFIRIIFYCLLVFCHTSSLLPPTTIIFIRSWSMISTFYSPAVCIVVTFILALITAFVRMGIKSKIFIFLIIIPWAMPGSTRIREEYWKNKYISELRTIKFLIENLINIISSNHLLKNSTRRITWTRVSVASFSFGIRGSINGAVVTSKLRGRIIAYSCSCSCVFYGSSTRHRTIRPITPISPSSVNCKLIMKSN